MIIPKKHLHYVVIMAVLLFIIGSCQKSDNLLPVEDNRITFAKEQFRKDSVAFVRSGLRPEYSFRQSLARQLEWGQAFSKGSLLYVPLKMILREGMFSLEGNNTLSNEAWMVVHKDENTNNTIYTLMTLFPDGTNSRKFTGMVFIEDYFLGNAKYTEYHGGQRVTAETRRSRHGGSSSGQAYSGTGFSNCRLVKIATVCVGDVNGGNAEPICGGRYERRCESDIGEWQLPLPDDDGALGPGGGGGSGGTVSPTDIKNKITQPCLRSMVDQILAEDIEFGVDRTLKSIFGQNASINLTFTQTTELPPLFGGLAIANYYERLPSELTYELPLDYLEVEIRLNANTLPNASQEYIAVTILHESVHAYLYSRGLIGGLANQHHDFMWTNYVGFIAGYLMDKYNTPERDARSLAMEGLQYTRLSMVYDDYIKDKYGNIPSNDRAEINGKYREGKKGRKCN